MFSSIIKILLICSAFMISLSGCGAPSGGGDSENSSDIASVRTPSIEVVSENGNINANWNDTGAAQYRVLYWQGNDAPQEFITVSTSYTFPPLGSGAYTVLVEAYDDLGNSLFSAPVALEVL